MLSSNTTKQTGFNLKNFLKTRKLYDLDLNNLVIVENDNFVLSPEPVFYSKTYLKLNQKYPPRANINLPMGALNHYKKREYKLIYELKEIQPTEKKVLLDLKALALNSFCKTNYLRHPKNIHVDHKADNYDISLKLLINHRNSAGHICNKNLKKELRKKVLQYLSDSNTKERYLENKTIILDILNRKLAKDILNSLGENTDYVKSVLVTEVRLK